MCRHCAAAADTGAPGLYNLPSLRDRTIERTAWEGMPQPGIRVGALEPVPHRGPGDANLPKMHAIRAAAHPTLVGAVG